MLYTVRLLYQECLMLSSKGLLGDGLLRQDSTVWKSWGGTSGNLWDWRLSCDTKWLKLEFNMAGTGSSNQHHWRRSAAEPAPDGPRGRLRRYVDKSKLLSGSKIKIKICSVVYTLWIPFSAFWLRSSTHSLCARKKRKLTRYSARRQCDALMKFMRCLQLLWLLWPWWGELVLS